MNILPKKSWHVRNKDNIERVRRDEENARKEEEERQRRAALADSEARTELLRSKAQLRQRNSDVIHEETRGQGVTSTASSQGVQHINFFSDLEEGKKSKKGNEEYEKEKREEKEKQEKAIGLLTYLGQSSVESAANKPWYLVPEKKQTEDEQEKLILKERDTKTKFAQDPMRTMSQYIGTKHKVEGKAYRPFVPQRSSHRVEEKRPEKRKRSPTSGEESSSSSSSEEERKRHKKHKKKHKKKAKKQKKKHKKHRDSSGERTETVLCKAPSASKTIQQLRAERLKREQAERMKTQKLLQKMKSGSEKDEVNSDSEKVETDERKRGYNSQYNPELARNRRKTKIDYSEFE